MAPHLSYGVQNCPPFTVYTQHQGAKLLPSSCNTSQLCNARSRHLCLTRHLSFLLGSTAIAISLSLMQLQGLGCQSCFDPSPALLSVIFGLCHPEGLRLALLLITLMLWPFQDVAVLQAILLAGCIYRIILWIWILKLQLPVWDVPAPQLNCCYPP